jgi:hypothetical protein
MSSFVIMSDYRPGGFRSAWLPGLAGTVWTLLPSPWFDQSTSTGALIFIYGIAGLCMAATVAMITGLGHDSALATVRRSKISILSSFRARRRSVLDVTSQRRKKMSSRE